ncbi:hypothetical protein C0Q70_20662 [Pomacea canaliculata]|uniref:U11/U12 small nuclear ribonucleoprotein 35 kDa protein n=1 Tax=Pomacea canaliculata TaxID=400727 RepID=A0A2T7NG76_POMCA|nr:U11/U12 small nuclear ribonucleoprotein 35 kDa protein-like [Pomacea canaliculata]PVD20168.1 hypothetical protein C0Q70_20662 [Pomacea canaliculata]
MDSFSPFLDKFYDPLMAGSIDGTDEDPHDRAITRALTATYKCNKFVKGDPKLTLFVARLSPKTEEKTLYNKFREFGKIKQLRLVRDIVTGFSKCYAFIEFEDERALRNAHKDAYKMVIDEKEILVEHEFERTLKGWIPRRLGGGLGGKKDSGQLRFGGRDRPFRKPIGMFTPSSYSSRNKYGTYQTYSGRSSESETHRQKRNRDERDYHAHTRHRSKRSRSRD